MTVGDLGARLNKAPKVAAPTALNNADRSTVRNVGVRTETGGLIKMAGI